MPEDTRSDWQKGGQKPIKIPQAIIDFAKEMMRAFGGLKPTVFVEGSKRKVCLELPFGETYAERLDIMVKAGVYLAKTEDIGDVEAVIIASEAWMGPPRKTMVMPSQDPDRIEVLIFNGLDVKSNTQTLETYACTRDKTQAVIDFKSVPMPEEGADVSGEALPTFLAGYRWVKK